jgi:hypothetical protein
MAFDFASATGTYPGDTANSYLAINVSIVGNAMTVRGQYSDPVKTSAAVVALSGTMTFPAADVSLITYVSVQITNTGGTVAMYVSTASTLTLQGSNLVEIYRTQIAANATSNENNAGNSEPDF